MKFCSKKGVLLHFNTHVILECANLLTVVDIDVIKLIKLFIVTI